MKTITLDGDVVLYVTPVTSLLHPRKPVTHWSSIIPALYGSVSKSKASIRKGLCCNSYVQSLCKKTYCFHSLISNKGKAKTLELCKFAGGFVDCGLTLIRKNCKVKTLQFMGE